MSRFRHLALVLLASAIFTFTPAAIAAQGNQLQPDPPIDVNAVATDVVTVDRQTLLAELQTPPLPSDLPELYFDGAIYIDPSEDPATGPTRAELGIFPFDDAVEGIPDIQAVSGSVAYIVRAIPTAFGGVNSTNSLSYLVVDPAGFDDLLNPKDALDEIVEGIENSFAQGPSGGLRLINVADVDDDVTEGENDIILQQVKGRLITYSLETNDASAAAQLYIVPVGNVFIFGLVTVGNDGPVDPGSLNEPAEDLTVAGIAHLTEAVERTKSQQP